MLLGSMLLCLQKWFLPLSFRRSYILMELFKSCFNQQNLCSIFFVVVVSENFGLYTHLYIHRICRDGWLFISRGNYLFLWNTEKNRSEFIWCSCVNSIGSSNKPVISKLTDWVFSFSIWSKLCVVFPLWSDRFPHELESWVLEPIFLPFMKNLTNCIPFFLLLIQKSTFF